MDDQRKYVQMAYIRVCRDSGWRFDYIRAAHFTAELIGISALEVWTQFSSLDIMDQIAKGEHPVVNNPEYDNRWSALEKQALEESRRSTKPHNQLLPEFEGWNK